MRFNHSLGVVAAGLVLACEAPAGDQTTVADPAAPAAAVVSADHSHHGGGHRGRFMLRRDILRLQRATAAFHSIPRAEQEGYGAFGDCFQDPTLGGMGFHWANQQLINDSTVDQLRPELLVYQPLPDGRKRLAAVEYIVFVDEWQAKGHQDPPKLFGQEFHINPTLLQKPFYLLHAWVWDFNPAGTFMDWNPRVHCPAS
jgi:hypothetical protein